MHHFNQKHRDEKHRETAQTTVLLVSVALLLLAPNLLMQILPGLLVALAGGSEDSSNKPGGQIGWFSESGGIPKCLVHSGT